MGSQVIIAVNWTGVYVVDDSEEILSEYSFPEIASVTAKSVSKDFLYRAFSPFFLAVRVGLEKSAAETFSSSFVANRRS